MRVALLVSESIFSSRNSGEPKFNIDETAFTGGWGRPQRGESSSKCSDTTFSASPRSRRTRSAVHCDHHLRQLAARPRKHDVRQPDSLADHQARLGLCEHLLEPIWVSAFPDSQVALPDLRLEGLIYGRKSIPHRSSLLRSSIALCAKAPRSPPDWDRLASCRATTLRLQTSYAFYSHTGTRRRTTSLPTLVVAALALTRTPSWHRFTPSTLQQDATRARSSRALTKLSPT